MLKCFRWNFIIILFCIFYVYMVNSHLGTFRNFYWVRGKSLVICHFTLQVVQLKLLSNELHWKGGFVPYVLNNILYNIWLHFKQMWLIYPKMWLEWSKLFQSHFQQINKVIKNYRREMENQEALCLVQGAKYGHLLQLHPSPGCKPPVPNAAEWKKQKHYKLLHGYMINGNIQITVHESV